MKKINSNKIIDEIEGIIYAYAVNHHNAREGDWRERRRVRNLAVEDLMDLFHNAMEEEFKRRLGDKNIIAGVDFSQDLSNLKKLNLKQTKQNAKLK